MRRFLIDCLLFIPIGFMFISLKPLISYYTGDYKLDIKHRWVYNVLIKSKKTNDKTSVVLIGDSVANQLYNYAKYESEINSFACTGVIGLVGQYIFLKEFLVNNKPKDVFVLCSKSFFNVSLTRPEVYQHFIKPFYNSKYKPLLSEIAIKNLEIIPYKNLSQIPHVLTSSWAPKIPAVYNESKFLSDLSAEYLVKIYELSKLYGFRLHILSTPVSVKFKNDIEQNARREIKNKLGNYPDLYASMNNYIESITYINESNFRDGIHLNKPQSYYEKYNFLINEMRQSGL